jgi:hypothetical protein
VLQKLLRPNPLVNNWLVHPCVALVSSRSQVCCTALLQSVSELQI